MPGGELRDQMAAGIRAVADANHQNLCACRSWPDACLSGYKPDQWEHGDEATFLTAALERLAESTRTAAERETRVDLVTARGQITDYRATLKLMAGEREEQIRRAVRAEAKVTEYEQYEADVRRILNTKSEALGRAETAIERARTDLTAMINRCILQAGHCRQRGDFQREREWAVVADNARKTLAALSPAGGSEKGCCTECGGSGHSGDEAAPGGLCWDCRGTGHPHDGPCVPDRDRTAQKVRALTELAGRVNRELEDDEPPDSATATTQPDAAVNPPQPPADVTTSEQTTPHRTGPQTPNQSRE